jgi:hypothetical protein
MFRFVVLADRAWSGTPAAFRLLFVVLAVAALTVVSVAPAFAGDSATTNPFRWK